RRVHEQGAADARRRGARPQQRRAGQADYAGHPVGRRSGDGDAGVVCRRHAATSVASPAVRTLHREDIAMKSLFVRAPVLSMLCAAALAAGCASKDPEIAAREYVASGDGYAQQKKFQEAIIEYRNAVNVMPGNAAAHYKLAEVYRAAGDPVQAYA